jgi:23S rRNA (uridine2552-2'-O)-methyltransferase
MNVAGGGGSLRGSRILKTRVKTARKRSNASKRWLERQLNDPYVAQAKKEGWRSRAAYKLLEINEKHPFLAKNQRIIDLGSAPGGWSQIATRVTGSTAEHPRVIALDYLAMEPVEGVLFLQKDILDEDTEALLLHHLGGHKADVVLSDMAAPTTGHQQTDHLRTVHLFELAEEFAYTMLAEGGTFLAKVFRGGTEQAALARLKTRFASVRHVKPPASRQESPELYMLAMGYKPLSPALPR